MRKLLWITLGVGVSCALFAYLLSREMCLPFGIAAGILALPGLKIHRIRRAALLLAGCMVGSLWFGHFYRITLDGAMEADGKTLPAKIHVTDFSYETGYGSAAECTLTLGDKSYQAKAYLKENVFLEPGTEASGEFRFRITTPDGQKAATYHQGRGVFLLLYQKGELAYSEGELTWKDRVAVLRRNIEKVLETAFSEDTAPFAKALLLGDTQNLGYAVDTDLKVSGIRHVAAVSGLHVSILFALLTTLTVKNRFLTALLGFPALVVFAALAGFTPSVVRSSLMLSLTLLGLLLNKSYDGPTALSFAVLTMLIGNPLTITDVGFQLSVGSVAGIYAVAGRISRFIGERLPKNRLCRWFANSVATTLGAMVFTTPLCALYFGTVSLIGVVTNLLTLWIISFIFYGILGVCLLGFFWPAGASALGWLIAWPIRYVLAAAKLLAHIPLAAVYTQSGFIGGWLVFVYLLLGFFWLSRKKRPGSLVCLATTSLCIALLASWWPAMTDDVRFTVLDVGQGQCLIFQSEGRTFLVDCGGDSDTASANTAAETLLSQGISHIDGVIVTHADRDHAGGVANILSRVDTDLLILPWDGADLAQGGQENVIFPDREILLTCGDTKITVFPPEFSGKNNENSLCVLFDTEKCDILITGDRSAAGEIALVERGTVPKVDVLVAGHHGAKDATCQRLLDEVDPEIVCISVSASNQYGHPSREVLQRLEDFGCVVYRTDLQGQIVIRR